MPVPERQLRATLAVLCLLAAAALLRQIVAPPWPEVSPPERSSISPPQGFQLYEMGVRPGERNRHWARSGTRRMALAADGSRLGAQSGTSLELDLTHLVARHPNDLQVAELTRSDPQLALQDRLLLQVSGQEVALGSISEDSVLQGCLVPSGLSGITSLTLGPISSVPPRDPIDRMLRLLGLRSHRSYECLLVTLRGSSDGVGHDQLLQLWQQWRSRMAS
ncbi:hypothetical protein [Synechococcus sp. GFB01]|uniref:hypothetical protein n=1 Tax=Synechococcus sp. GFB01 TaxID=1662190 RepID=UPI00064E82AD|nr:hypothetical protein [Synechococcus sp. GFB01]KMM17260.1 hypothetical protein SYNGFB01_05315 [Synechococcus sp. GFB01]